MRNCTRDEGRPFGFGDQVADAPRDGRPLLLWARLNVDGCEFERIVGCWDKSNDEWRLKINDTGTELKVRFWMELPHPP
jgi:hypothetical protein